jgi:hypothetical protein
VWAVKAIEFDTHALVAMILFDLQMIAFEVGR